MSMEPENEDLSTKRVFTTGEAAQICKVSQQTIIRCFDSGRLTGFRVPGSKFRRIPRDELVRFMRANNIPLSALGSGRKRVLAVDDDPRIVELYVDLLGRDGRFDVKTAGNGYDAGLLTEAFRPQLIILDYMLPDINGNIVCQRVRENANLADTKVLCVSGVVNQAEIDGLISAGANAFLKKPFDVPVLMGKIEELLELEAEAGEEGQSSKLKAQSSNGNGVH
ncbi:MAG TPA: response regulator [Phycisphaerales bacterium]|nr:response regulator [Phycisphaerales bacterium]